MKLDIPLSPSQFEPKRNNRFIVELPEECKIEPYFINSVTLPKLKDQSNWSDLILTFYDPIGPSISQRLMDSIRKMNAEFDKGKIYELSINSLDPVNEIIEKWVVRYSKYKMVDFGDLNFANDGLKLITMKIKPIHCILAY